MAIKKKNFLKSKYKRHFRSYNLYIYGTNYRLQNLHSVLKWLADALNVDYKLCGFISSPASLSNILKEQQPYKILHLKAIGRLRKNPNFKNAYKFSINILLKELKKARLDKLDMQSLAFNKALQIALYFSELFMPKIPKFYKMLKICDKALQRLNTYYIERYGFYDVAILHHQHIFKSHVAGLGEQCQKAGLKTLYAISSFDGIVSDEFKHLRPQLALPWHIWHHLSLSKIFVSMCMAVFTRGRTKKFWISHAFLSGAPLECFERCNDYLSISGTTAYEHLKRYGLDKKRLKLVKTGYASLDYKLAHLKEPQNNPQDILCTINRPELLSNQNFKKLLKDILHSSLCKKLIFRPHHYMKNTDEYQTFKLYFSQEAANCIVFDEEDILSTQYMSGAYLLISDYSSLLFTFVFTTKQPALIYDEKARFKRKNNPFYNPLLHLCASNPSEALQKIKDLKSGAIRFNKINEFLKQDVYNLGRANDSIAAFIKNELY